MFKRIFILMLSVSLLATTFAPKLVWAQTSGTADAAEVARTRARIEQFGRNARVEVKLRDNTKLKGFISAVEQDSFTITDPKRGETRVDYAEVSTLKKSSGGLSTRTWIIIGAVVAGALVAWGVGKGAVCDGGAQSRFPC